MRHSRVDDFPGVFPRIRSVLSSGPVLQEDEYSSASSNRPRNDAFAYFLSGELLRAGIRVFWVDGIAKTGVSILSQADIGLEWQKKSINVECKRPRTSRSLAKRANEAYSQLSGHNGASFGIAAIDCSPYVRRPRTLIEAASGEEAYEFLAQEIESAVLPRVPKPRSASILGIGLFARVPAMIRKSRSEILAPTGKPYTNYAPYSVTGWVFFSNPSSPNGDLLKSLAEAMGP